MWPWERKAYVQGYEEGRRAQRESDEQTMLPEGDRADRDLSDAVRKERAAGDERTKIAVDEMRRKLSELLWEARRDLPDDSPMHGRIKRVLAGMDHHEQLDRIEKFAPGSVKRP